MKRMVKKVETASSLLPIILYSLLSILIVFIIVLVYKMIIAVDKTNKVLDDVYIKVKKLDNLFMVIDRSADTINMVTDKVAGIIGSSILKIFKRKRKVDDYE